MDNNNPLSTSPLPSSMRAIVQGGSSSGGGGLQVADARPLPQPRADELLVRVEAVAVNPCDWKMPARFPSPGTSVGSDFAGTVVAVGADLATAPGRLGGGGFRMGDRGFRVGDRVASAVHGANPGDPTTGSFADYVCCVAALAWKLPAGMSWTDGAAIGGCGVGTAGLALFARETMGLDFSMTPQQGDDDAAAARSAFVLVYGGSTATGTMAIQLLKLAGFRVATTCSAASVGLVKGFGADAAFDYRSATCAADIKAHTRGALRYALDVITDARSMATCEAALGRGGGRYVGLEAVPDEDVLSGQRGLRTRSVRWTWVLGVSLVGRGDALETPYRFGFSQERRDWGAHWFHTVQHLVDRGCLAPHPPRLMDGGLPAVPQGVAMMEKGLVRGEKLVYKI